MNIEYLKYFSTVAELGSINKAAHALFISQPHLGNIIRDLEDELGIVLFQRTRRGVMLTPEGAEFLGHATKILDEYQNIFSSGFGARQGKVSLEVSMTRFSHIMESFIEISVKHRNDPEFSHHLNEGGADDVIDDVYTGLSKIGVLSFDISKKNYYLSKFSSKNLEYHYLANARPCILVSNNHPLIREGKPITLENLSHYGFVRFTGQDEDFMNHIQKDKEDFNLNKSKQIIFAHARSTLLYLIGKSDFYGIGIYDFDTQEDSYNVKSVPVEGCGDTFEFGYITQKGSIPSPITTEFVENLKTHFSTK